MGSSTPSGTGARWNAGFINRTAVRSGCSMRAARVGTVRDTAGRAIADVTGGHATKGGTKATAAATNCGAGAGASVGAVRNGENATLADTLSLVPVEVVSHPTAPPAQRGPSASPHQLFVASITPAPPMLLTPRRTLRVRLLRFTSAGTTPPYCSSLTPSIPEL